MAHRRIRKSYNGTCPICKREVHLTKKGRIPIHDKKDDKKKCWFHGMPPYQVLEGGIKN